MKSLERGNIQRTTPNNWSHGSKVAEIADYKLIKKYQNISFKAVAQKDL
jgi:hypothetical protein